MAKLTARKRTELARVERERDVTDSSLITWERRTLALMSDGTVLEKRDVRFKPTSYSEGERHSYGWKVLGKAKADLTPDRFREVYLAKGFVNAAARS